MSERVVRETRWKATFAWLPTRLKEYGKPKGKIKWLVAVRRRVKTIYCTRLGGFYNVVEYSEMQAGDI